MKLVALDGVLTAQGKAIAGFGPAKIRCRSLPVREKMFLSEAGSYVRRTANHREDPVLCELCGSATEAFQAQQISVDMFGHVAQVVAWKNDDAGHHLRIGSGSSRFCSAHNQRNDGSRYRSAFKASGDAARWRVALGVKRSCSVPQSVVGRDISLSLSSPRVGERLISERLTQLAEAERHRQEFTTQFWSALSGSSGVQPVELDGASSIELTHTHPGDEREYGLYKGGAYRAEVCPGLYDRCLSAFPVRSRVSRFLSWRSDTAITTRSGTRKGLLDLPAWMQDFFNRNAWVGPYEDFERAAAREKRECRDLVLWVPDVRGWVCFESMKSKWACDVSGDLGPPRVRTQTVTLVYEQAEQWKWALKVLWSRTKPMFDHSLGTYVLPESVDGP